MSDFEMPPLTAKDGSSGWWGRAGLYYETRDSTDPIRCATCGDALTSAEAFYAEPWEHARCSSNPGRSWAGRRHPTASWQWHGPIHGTAEDHERWASSDYRYTVTAHDKHWWDRLRNPGWRYYFMIWLPPILIGAVIGGVGMAALLWGLDA